ncbi:MAG: AMP-binding protein [Microthrixaceae bacterium]|nr:AMP-binding protein [Microthrixaceae bacterium]
MASEFLRCVEECGSSVALREMVGDSDWVEYTFDELATKVAATAGGLRALGVGPGDRVVMMMRNIPAFHWVDLATLFLGATPVSIYNSSAADQVEYLVSHCGAKVAVLEDQSFLDRFTPVRGRIDTSSRWWFSTKLPPAAMCRGPRASMATRSTSLSRPAQGGLRTSPPSSTPPARPDSRRV